MEPVRKPRGRPRKEKDTIEPWQFGRAAIGTCAYDEARARGEKHSAAITETVGFVKQHSPEVHISETEVRRILARYRPRGSQTILRFTRKILSEDEIKTLRWCHEQLTALQGRKGLKLEVPPNFDLGQKRTAITFSIAERPNYPRHNHKKPQE
jgi:hypothetical protein